MISEKRTVFEKLITRIKQAICKHEYVLVHETQKEVGYACMKCDKEIYLKRKDYDERELYGRWYG